MKTGLIDDDVADELSASNLQSTSSLIGQARALFAHLLAPQTPWEAGQDAFYTTKASNPHPAGSAPYQEWQQGYEAAAEAFEW